jgi:hypothetical protein
MITIWHKTKRGASQGYTFTSKSKAVAHMSKLWKRRINATARDHSTSETVGEVWQSADGWNWYLDIDYLEEQ